MAVPFISTAFVAGEIAPSLFGHIDLAKFHVGAATFRNGFVSYRGGYYSRAGTAFVGFSKQTGRSYPPRLVPFQFSINQGLALEFGNEYMRVVSNGAFVTEGAISITGATQADPAVISATAFGVVSATPVNSGVTVAYAPGDSITLTGGVATTQAVLGVTDTELVGVSVGAPGAAYIPGQTITPAGGTQSTPAGLTIAATQVASATIANGGSGGTNGTRTVTGTTGTGTKFQASVTVAGGAITAVLSITVGGIYTTNPTVLTAEPVTGGGLTGAELSVVMGVESVTISANGVFTANPAGGTFTQASTSGSGTGVTFQSAVLAPHAVTVTSPGVYGTEPANPVSQGSTTGVGTGAEFDLSWGPIGAFNDGDWVYLAGISGMTQLNGRTVIVESASVGSFAITDVYGNPINSTTFGAYTGGGTASRIFTLPTPYGEADLSYLKFTQSADVMSLTCWNQQTGTSYPPQDLKRATDDEWSIGLPQFGATILPPATVSGAANLSGDTDVQFVVTSTNPADGTESVASAIADIPNAVDNAETAGVYTVTWSTVSGVQQYNIYKAPQNPAGSVPTGALFGYAGTAYGNQFTDTNITPDFSQVPPLHENPFAVGAIVNVDVIETGTGFTSAPTITVITSSGSGEILEPVIVNGGLVAVIPINPGANFQPGDQAIVSGGGGVGAVITLSIGPQTGTYPSVVAYYQERRIYASSPNNPDTYWMSQPGAFTNFDARIPTIDSDAITGTPWSVEVNGIQFMVSMPGGLVVLTGLSAWQLTGVGGSSLNPQPITPSNQQAQPQAYNGCSATVPPVKIDYDIIYLQAKGSIFRDLSYNFFVNIYTGQDITEISSQLFTGYTIREVAWCEEPFKIMWAVRSDGALLSLTFVKPQEVQGWSRSDTNGLFVSCCAVTEPPVDALYLATQRFPGGNTAYMIERMDNRIWSTAENCWCVDCGLSLPQPAPNAMLTASSPAGLGAITGVSGLAGGENYSSGTTAAVVDDNGQGPGAGAVPTLTIVAGVIAAVTFAPGSQGNSYTQPKIIFTDPAGTGSGASAAAVLDNSATFIASAGVFSLASIGSVIRMGGGIASVTGYTDSQHVIANILSPIVATIPNSGTPPQVATQAAGSWTLTAPVMSVSGLEHLAGMTVTGLADGNVIPATTVPSSGTIALPVPASAVTLGLGFTAQLQSVYLEVGQPTVQGQRKKIAEVTARLEASRGVQMGSNQPDGSTLSPPQIAPPWQNLGDVPDWKPGAVKKPFNSTFQPLYTGDRRIPVKGGFGTQGQVALQQTNPLPMQILALIPEIDAGDLPQSAGPARAQPEQQMKRAA